MWDFNISTAFKLMVKSAPYIGFRLIVYLGIAFAFAIVGCILAGVGWIIGLLGDDAFQASAASNGGILGFLIGLGALYYFRAQLFFFVKTGHLDVLMRVYDEKDVPFGRKQVEFAISNVRLMFQNPKQLYAVDKHLLGVNHFIHDQVDGIEETLRLPPSEALSKVARFIVNGALSFMDEVILTYVLRNSSKNPWASSSTGLVYYAQNSTILVKNAILASLLMYGILFIVFLFMLSPASTIMSLMPGAWSMGTMIFAILFTWAIKRALLEPFVIACMMQLFYMAVDEQDPDPIWEQGLAEGSKKYVRIKERAAGAT